MGYVLLMTALGLENTSAHAQANASATDPAVQTVRRLLAIPEASLDLAKAKLAIDQLIDPSLDVAGTSQQLDAMAAQARALVPANASKRDTVVALQTYLYASGPWNRGRPFKYDLDDPYGHDIRNKLLSTYLASRKGNCVSMPLLFIVLGQKLGLDVTAAEAPEHVLVKFRDEHGQFFNIEATSGGFKADASYRQALPMTDEALANGIYMRRLSKRETVLVMAHTLLELWGQDGQQARRIALADLILTINPKDVMAMLHEGGAYYQLLQKHFLSKYASVSDIPETERLYFEELGRNNQLWFNRAEALGWRQSSQAAEAQYQQTIQRAKATH
jgi:regulator of sirC expression with transglutaminase-like and TPR domain